MTRTLTRCQFIAFGAGVLLCFAIVGWLWVVQKLPSDRPSGNLGFILHISGLLVVPAIFASAVARYAGPYRGVAYITCGVPAVWLFLVQYIFDIQTWGTDSRRSVMLHVIGYTPPFDLAGQVLKALPLAGAALLCAFVGIGAERLWAWRRGEVEEYPASSHPKRLVFPLTILVLGLFIIGGLTLYARQVLHDNTPAGRIAIAEGVLHSTASEEEKARALRDLESLRIPEAIPVLQDVIARQSPPLQAYAAGLLVGRGDLSALPLFAAALRADPDSPIGRRVVHMGDALGRIDDPSQIPFLCEMLRHPGVDRRRGAAYALRGLADPVTIPDLLTGLSDSDETVRYNCLYTLQHIAPGTHPLPTPSVSSFAADEQKYLDYWHQWGRTHGYLPE